MKLPLEPLQALENIIETFIDKDSADIKTVRTALIKENELDNLMKKYDIKSTTDLDVILAEYFAEVKEHTFRCK